LVKLKKDLYSNPDIESPMTEDEKLLTNIIAQKFSKINQEISLLYNSGLGLEAKSHKKSC
jgi:hypothetical protein